jgi:Copper binding proteins, plastocyanin/azurin family
MGNAKRMLLVASLVAAAGVSSAATFSSGAATAEPLVGRWEMAGGIFEFVEQGSGMFTNRVIRQRTGVVCGAVNDRNGQLVLRKKAERVYVGTWQWFDTTSCQRAGRGAITITVAKKGATAKMVALPPPGVESPTITLTLTKVATSAGSARLVGTTGPGFVIGMRDTKSGPVTSLRAGRYTLVVADKSASHDFHLTGPGINRVITSVTFVGRVTFTATLKKGTYAFFCDPHASSMRGSFRVT